MTPHVRHPGSNSAADYALSNTGRLVYVPAADSGNAKSSLVWVDRAGRVVGQAVSDFLQNPRDRRLSPDGRGLALTTGPSGNGDLWVYDLSGRPPIPLATKGDDRYAAWSPDSTRIAYTSIRGTTFNVYIAPADGSVTDPMPLRHEMLQAQPEVWSAKGELILHMRTGDIAATSADGKGKVLGVVATPDPGYDPALSPNGRWLAYTSTRTGRPEIWVKGYPEGVAKRVSANGGREPVWSRDGTELFYLQGNAMMAVPVNAEEKFSFDAAKKLFTGSYFISTNSFVRSYDVARDGRFLMIQPSASSAEPSRVVVVQNWLQELKRLVPTK